MNIVQSQIKAKKLSLHVNNLKGDNFQVKPLYFKHVDKIVDDTYLLTLVIELKNTKDNPFPVDLVVEFESMFKFKDYKDEEEIMNFLNITAIQMVFPIMRASVNSLITSALLPPLVLPLIPDVRTVFIEK
jgi:preprotein translocase subunit SecB